MLTLLLIDICWAAAIYLLARRLGVRPRGWVVPVFLAPAAPALVSIAWGAHFWVEPGTPTADQPDIITQMLTYCFYASIALGLAAPVLAKGYRLPTAIFALPQIPIAWFVGFVGVMQVTGVWL